ncbi:hypothetical protein D7193_11865 [Micromonospora costi]|uniref:Uncharacterized protein n=1 Tax=Micromonospora costi TaxID=1530042 RepID=A0A3B0A4L1_9ACTN|nr:hypothetical protein D7193_11865 [Micromonospora costi]
MATASDVMVCQVAFPRWPPSCARSRQPQNYTPISVSSERFSTRGRWWAVELTLPDGQTVKSAGVSSGELLARQRPRGAPSVTVTSALTPTTPAVSLPSPSGDAAIANFRTGAARRKRTLRPSKRLAAHP